MNAAEDIRLRWDTFKQRWAVMWRAFGKDAPKGAFRDDVWEQCQYIPLEAWDYIVQCIRDLDSPPRNWAKKLKALHYQWTETSLPKAAKKEQRGYCEGPLGSKILEMRERGQSAGFTRVGEAMKMMGLHPIHGDESGNRAF